MNILNEINQSIDRLRSSSAYYAVLYVHPDDLTSACSILSKNFNADHDISYNLLKLPSGGTISVRTLGVEIESPENNARNVMQCICGQEVVDIFIDGEAFGKSDEEFNYYCITRFELIVPYLTSRLRPLAGLYPRLIVC